MIVRLVVEGGRRRRVVEVRPPQAVVGRGHGNAVRIPSAEVSRRHCRLRLEDGLVTVEDLDSINGTFLNGRRVREAQEVRPGDRLGVGPVTFVVEYDLTPPEVVRPADEEDPEVLLVAEDEPSDCEGGVLLEGPAPQRRPRAEPAPEPAAPEEAQPEFSFEGHWQVPEGEDLRDLLGRLEDESVRKDSPPQGRREEKKRKQRE
jgi:predicted component of type VI protein secretion system